MQRIMQWILAVSLAIAVTHSWATEQVAPLPSWQEGSAKQAIIDFVNTTTRHSSPDFVPLAQRVATFDQDGTLWVEQPLCAQLRYCIDSVPALIKIKPELPDIEPFKTVLTGDHKAIAKLSHKSLYKIIAATLTGMSVDDFSIQAQAWLDSAKDSRWHRSYTELTYLPMQELLNYLRANGYKTYLVTGGGQDFVRLYAQSLYGIPPEQVIGSAASTQYDYDAHGVPLLNKEPTLLINNNDAGKPEAIHLMIGRRPYAAFGNSTGDRQMLEYTKAG